MVVAVEVEGFPVETWEDADLADYSV